MKTSKNCLSKAKNNSLNVCIKSFCDVGNFIGFSPKIPDAILNASSSHSKNATSTGPEQSNTSHIYTLETGYKCLLQDCILSKQSGKIYKIPEEISSNYIPSSCKVLADKSLFLISDYGEIYRMFENENGLNIQKIGSIDGCAALDKFGNVLTKRGIFSTSDLKFYRIASYFEDTIINYDPLLEVFWAKNNGDFYIFDENGKFIKINDIVGGYTKEIVAYNDGWILTYKNGTYIDEYREHEKVIFNDRNTWNFNNLISWANQSIEINSEKSDYYKKLIDTGFANITKEEFSEAWPSGYGIVGYTAIQEDGSLITYENLNSQLQEWTTEQNDTQIIYPYRSYYNRESTYYTNKGKFTKTKVYAYLCESINDNNYFNAGFANNIIRGNAAYTIKDYNIYKYSFDDDSIKKIAFNEYDIETISIENNLIAVTGVNENFEEFKGYLDIDDQVSFEKVSEENSTIILNPIN